MTNQEQRQRKLDILRSVFENESPCPTLLDLDRVARGKAGILRLVGESDDDLQQWIDEHLPNCEQCELDYTGLLALSRAATKAIDKVSVQQVPGPLQSLPDGPLARS